MTLPDPFELVAAALNCDVRTLSPESGLNAHQRWDSLGHVAVVMELESHYGVVLDDDSIRLFEAMEAIIALHRQLEQRDR
jgi:acyl carrier protein